MKDAKYTFTATVTPGGSFPLSVWAPNELAARVRAVPLLPRGVTEYEFELVSIEASEPDAIALEAPRDVHPTEALERCSTPEHCCCIDADRCHATHVYQYPHGRKGAVPASANRIAGMALACAGGVAQAAVVREILTTGSAPVRRVVIPSPRWAGTTYALHIGTRVPALTMSSWKSLKSKLEQSGFRIVQVAPPSTPGAEGYVTFYWGGA